MGDGMQSLDRDEEEISRVANLLVNAWIVSEGFVPNVSYISTFVDMARAVVKDARGQRDALLAVRQAWLDAGPEPAYHRMHQDSLRRNWPVLYDAIRKVVDNGRG